MQQNATVEIREQFESFLREYYHEDIANLARSFPKDTTSLTVDFLDLWRSNPDLADDLREHPGKLLPVLEDAVGMVDHPINQDLTDVTVRITGLNDEHCYAPGDVRSEHAGRLVGITGTLERVTTTSDIPEQLVHECQRDGNVVITPQDPSSDGLQEPHSCPNCERQGPFRLLDTHEKSEWSDYAKLRIQSRPDVGEGSDGKLRGYALNDLIDHGGEDGLVGRAGEPVTVYGVLERQQKSGNGENDLLFDHVLRCLSVEFERDDETVDVEAHRDTFKELAARDDAIDLWQDSIAPQLHTTDAWDAAMEFAIPYLFGAPRIDIPRGPTYRGDLHFLLVSDFGMGKSTFKEDIEAYSPKCISKSTTALSSGVGLTAAAVKDDFGEGQWTIKPGLLVRANGGHLLLDEIDKGPDELTDMNDALVGHLRVTDGRHGDGQPD